MLLKSRYLLANRRFVEVAKGNALLKQGSQGNAVAQLQLAMVALGFPMPRSVHGNGQSADGIFGSETKATVKALQRCLKRQEDGIVGPNTLTVLDQRIYVRQEIADRRLKTKCKCVPQNTRGLQHLGRDGTASASTVNYNTAHMGYQRDGGGHEAALYSEKDIELFNKKIAEDEIYTSKYRMRRLTSKEQRDATKMFGNSLDYNRIFISPKLNSRGFRMTETEFMHIELSTFRGKMIPFNIMLVGGLMNDPEDYPKVFFHELTHCWQSQHHRRPRAYINASFTNYGLNIIKHWDMEGWKRTYDVVPGKAFEKYNSEQVAELVEFNATPNLAKDDPDLFSTSQAIVTHIRNAPKNHHDTLNAMSLNVIG